MAVFTSTVRTITDGDPVNQTTDNGPISDLTQRTDWLKDQLTSITAGTQLLLRDQAIISGLVPGDVVYYDNTTSQFQGALADVDSSNLSLAAATSFWQGVLSAASGTVGNIIIGGQLTLTQTAWAAAYEGGVFVAGDLFLSTTTSGKYTTSPGTTSVYIGHMSDDGSGNGTMLVSMNRPNGFLEHVHYSRTTLGKPAGTPNTPAFGAIQSITSPDTAQQGWLPATVTYFPGFVTGVQIPTGAVFGYNITNSADSDLAEVFPFVPSENAEFVQGGITLGSDLIVANEYGIWWMDDSYGTAPWPVDYNTTALAADIGVWTSRLVAATAITDLVTQAIINELENGEINSMAVSSVLAGTTDGLEITGTTGSALAGWKGQVTFTNTGVTALRPGRGINASAPGGDATLGYRLLVDLSFGADLPAQHLFTNVDAANVNPTETMSLLTSNGVTSGTTLGVYGHRLGSQTADFIDFLIPAGSDLVAATDYRVTVRLQAGLDTVTGTPTDGEVDVSFYRLTNGEPVSTSQYQRTVQSTYSTGLPGQLQTATLGPYADVIVQQDDQLLVRISLSSGVPVPSDSFRLLAMYYSLDPV